MNKAALIKRVLEMLADLYLAESVDRNRELIHKFSLELKREQSTH